jgi:hypothetical protein
VSRPASLTEFFCRGDNLRAVRSVPGERARRPRRNIFNGMGKERDAAGAVPDPSPLRRSH